MEDYNVQIHVRGDVVESMECDCPYAESGNKCKHMAAVLFAYENYLSENDCEDDEEEYEGEKIISSWEARFDRQKKEIV